MFALKKAISPFLLPPGIFVIILIGSGLYLLRKSWKAGVMNMAIAVFIWLAAIHPVSNMLTRGLETGLPVPPHPRGDVIVLLGGGLRGGLPTGETLARIVAAAKLFKILHVSVIISAGSAFKREKPEAPVDARFLESQGVPAKEIILEDKSRDTLENAEYSKKICERYHFERPVLVTSTFHMKRALLCFGHLKMHASAFPAEPIERKKTWGWIDYLPSNFSDTRAALHEYIGIVYLKLLFEAQKIRMPRI